ncbi:MAG TPA: hypothetical protein VLA89_06105 [Gemmatimonadales bacterium]|nr:hypothetical protein [Gemmatimonadales bacterium]
MSINGGNADSIYLEADEDGWHLIIEGDLERVNFNVHGMSHGELQRSLAKIVGELDEWYAEGRWAARQHEMDLAAQEYAEAFDRMVGDH